VAAFVTTVKGISAVENKPWYLSKTIWGAVVAFLGVVMPKLASALGASPGDQADTLVNIASGVVGLVGTTLAIYGRYKATATIGPKQ
jgi:hypothetical protein